MKKLLPVTRVSARRPPKPCGTDPEWALDRILVLLARPRGRGETLRLLTDRMSLCRARFQTGDRVEASRELEVQILLSGGLAVSARGRVEAVEETPGGQWRGTLALDCPTPERGILDRFLKRHGTPV